MGGVVVVDEHLEPGCLPLDATLGVLEVRHQQRGYAIGPIDRVAEGVARLRQASRRLRRQIEITLAVAEARNAYAGWIL
jgi:hypothetical protein